LLLGAEEDGLICTPPVGCGEEPLEDVLVEGLAWLPLALPIDDDLEVLDVVAWSAPVDDEDMGGP